MKASQYSLVFVPVLSLLGGCAIDRTSSPSSPPNFAAISISRRGPVTPTVNQSTDYLAAERAYADGDYAGALRRIDTLLDRELAAADRDFLRRQQSICRQKLTNFGPPQVAPISATPTPPATGADCGPLALQAVCRKLGLRSSVPDVHQNSKANSAGASLQQLTDAAKKLGLKAEGIQVDLVALKKLDCPAVVWVDGNHYLALMEIRDGRATIVDPNGGGEEEIEPADLLKRSGGILLTVRR